MRRKTIAALALALMLTLSLAACATANPSPPPSPSLSPEPIATPSPDDVIIFAPEEDFPGFTVPAEMLGRALDVLRQRLDSLGHGSASVSHEDGEITVVVPDLEDRQGTVEALTAAGALEFRLSTGEVVMTGENVTWAEARYNVIDGTGTDQHHVYMRFDEEGAALWAEGTGRAAGMGPPDNYIAVVMDDEVLFSPTVSPEYAATGIVGGSCIVTFVGARDAEQDARRFAALIQSGQLPFALKETDPTDG